jgi:anti-sigma B factor antagonist
MLPEKNAMALKLTTRISGEVTVIDLSGRLTLGEGPAALRKLLQEVTAAGGRKIVLNLKDVSSIDSSGLGELVSSHVNAKHNGGSLKMVGVPKRVQELFRMTGINKVVDIHEDEPNAIRSWALNATRD